jgi:hypothetical protein
MPVKKKAIKKKKAGLPLPPPPGPGPAAAAAAATADSDSDGPPPLVSESSSEGSDDSDASAPTRARQEATKAKTASASAAPGTNGFKKGFLSSASAPAAAPAPAPAASDSEDSDGLPALISDASSSDDDTTPAMRKPVPAKQSKRAAKAPFSPPEAEESSEEEGPPPLVADGSSDDDADAPPKKDKKKKEKAGVSAATPAVPAVKKPAEDHAVVLKRLTEQREKRRLQAEETEARAERERVAAEKERAEALERKIGAAKAFAALRVQSLHRRRVAGRLTAGARREKEAIRWNFYSVWKGLTDELAAKPLNPKDRFLWAEEKDKLDIVLSTLRLEEQEAKEKMEFESREEGRYRALVEAAKDMKLAGGADEEKQTYEPSALPDLAFQDAAEEEEEEGEDGPPAAPLDQADFANRVYDWFERADQNYKEMFLNRLEKILSGSRTYSVAKRLAGCDYSVFEAKLDRGTRVLWSELRRLGENPLIFVSLRDVHAHINVIYPGARSVFLDFNLGF